MVTSRERLNLREEWVLTLDGLPFPTDEAALALVSYPAVQLFVQHAQRIQVTFSLAENEEAVRAICHQVEGMPLGLELAATWLRAMTCAQIAAQMATSLDFLATPMHDVPERHRSARTVFEHSWKMLSATEQTVLRRLSVFRGGFDVEGAGKVTGASIFVLASLVDKSLIRLNAAGRYDLHELLRQFAADKLNEMSETEVTTRDHFEYFLKLGAQAEAHQFGSEQTVWFDRLEKELDNLRAALSRFMGSEQTLQLLGSLGWFLIERLHSTDWFGWFERALAANTDADPAIRAKALYFAGALTWQLGNADHRDRLCEQALALARSVHDRRQIAWSLFHAAPTNAAAFDELVAMFRELGDPMGLTHVLWRRAWFARKQQDFARARVTLEEARQYADKFNDKVMIGWGFYLRGWLYIEQHQDYEQAKQHFESSLKPFREAHYLLGCVYALMDLGMTERAIGEDLNAQHHFEEALILLRNTPPGRYFPEVLIELAMIAEKQGQLKRATALLGAANGNVPITELTTTIDPSFSFERAVTALRSRLGEDVFAEAWSVGITMTTHQAINYVLADRTATRDVAYIPSDAQGLTEPLSTRELEVLTLIAQGLSNAEIAQELYLSVGTVKVHTRSIYSKLGVDSRTQAVAQAQALNLL
jgi:DNA-binding CsgD family transcriptional regulator/tetratricopeptide (TPR) repeat protein